MTEQANNHDLINSDKMKAILDKLADVIEGNDLTDTEAGAALALTLASLEGWPPDGICSMVIDVVSQIKNIPPVQLISNSTQRLLLAVAKRGDPEAQALVGSIVQTVRAQSEPEPPPRVPSGPRRVIHVGRRHRRPR